METPPVDRVEKVKVSEVKRLEFGFRTVKEGADAQHRDVPEAPMLPDENSSMSKPLSVHRIVDIEKFLFEVTREKMQGSC